LIYFCVFFVCSCDGWYPCIQGRENRNGWYTINERVKLDACIRKNPPPCIEIVEAKGRSMHLVWKLTPKEKKTRANSLHPLLRNRLFCSFQEGEGEGSFSCFNPGTPFLLPIGGRLSEKMETRRLIRLHFCTIFKGERVLTREERWRNR
jgi:hypothetical protein